MPFQFFILETYPFSTQRIVSISEYYFLEVLFMDWWLPRTGGPSLVPLYYRYRSYSVRRTEGVRDWDGCVKSPTSTPGVPIIGVPKCNWIHRPFHTRLNLIDSLKTKNKITYFLVYYFNS